MMIEGRVHSIETFGSVDGPGTRFIIFLQGCAMRCLYCHNVDTWDAKKGGELRTADDLLDQAERYRPYWGPEGGITVCGGEPLLQLDFMLDRGARPAVRCFRNTRCGSTRGRNSSLATSSRT